MNSSVVLALALAKKAPNPADVKPGWLAFFIFLIMFAAVILLWLSMRKQLRKVDQGAERGVYDESTPHRRTHGGPLGGHGGHGR